MAKRKVDMLDLMEMNMKMKMFVDLLAQIHCTGLIEYIEI